MATAQSLVTFTPSLSIGSVYDDNLFARTVGTGDQMTLLTPGIEASYSKPASGVPGTLHVRHAAIVRPSGAEPVRSPPPRASSTATSASLEAVVRDRGPLRPHPDRRRAELQYRPAASIVIRRCAGRSIRLSHTSCVPGRRLPRSTTARRSASSVRRRRSKISARFTVTRQNTPRASFGFGYSASPLHQRRRNPYVERHAVWLDVMRSLPPRRSRCRPDHGFRRAGRSNRTSRPRWRVAAGINSIGYAIDVLARRIDHSRRHRPGRSLECDERADPGRSGGPSRWASAAACSTAPRCRKERRVCITPKLSPRGVRWGR